MDDNIYHTRWIKNYREYGKDQVIFTVICGRRDVVCFRKTANHSTNDKWYSDKQSSIEEENVRIVKCAARLIKDSICEVQYHISKSPLSPWNRFVTRRELTPQWMPHVLRTFMEKLTANKLKQISIDQSISRDTVPSRKKPGRRIWCKMIVQDLDLLYQQFCLVLVLHWIHSEFGCESMINKLARLAGIFQNIRWDQPV